MELRHFDKNFVKNTREKTPQRILEIFSFRYSFNYILNGKFNPKIDSFFFQNQGTLFDFQKKTEDASPYLPSCAPVSVAEHASISLNILKERDGGHTVLPLSIF